ncbi:MOSC domain-containing protein [Paenibacillus pabuli]|uniref:MOSC domain-containing protein n=1 Tax=Paenibacillus pabuli TaxID=1472 RepID=UPI003242DC70
MGTVQFVLLADDPSTFVTRPVPLIDVELAGIPGDRHYGLLRPADSRQKIYKRGTPIANRRQISIVSEEECALIAELMNIPEVRPEWLGANMLVRGIDRLTELPAGTRLLFPDGTGLICEGENLPCVHPGKMIEQVYKQDGLRKKFVPAARKKRGIVCSVEREGVIHTGDTIEVKGLS